MEILFAILCLSLAYIAIHIESNKDSISRKENGEPFDYNKKIEPFVYCFLFTTIMAILGVIFNIIKPEFNAELGKNLIKISLWYVALRIMLFDYLHNIHRFKQGLSKQLDIFYLGTTASTDILLKKWGINFLVLALMRFLVGQILIILAIFL